MTVSPGFAFSGDMVSWEEELFPEQTTSEKATRKIVTARENDFFI
ncbi:MAG: hypothetical protein OP8BY_0723 [Candidatus Saccharicenans subterraneus]|uniref:Uncharacterized protein n=1 Tax=Candidatus Saccharicenans subterraneus TaxID=2508984 RepID=A0A3E2BKB3_9BACT|nr:MAG: hypothetical protein OP8BY_0723 [Candidatus Saccharicenans subterraneum]